MQKSELRKLRSLPATKEMMLKGKRFTELKRKRWDYLTNKYTTIIPEYDQLIRIQNLNGYIKIAVFLPNDMRNDINTPRYEVFINAAGKEWINRILDKNGNEVKWSNAMIGNLEGIRVWDWSSSEEKTYLNADAKFTLNRLEVSRNLKSTGLKRLLTWQQDCRKEEIKRKEEKEQKQWDEDMGLIPDLPKSFKEWMRKDVCKDFFIIYDYKKGGAKEGFCSRCRNTVKIKNPKHDGKAKCPVCRAEARYKASGRIKTLATDPYFSEIIQKIEGGIAIRRFREYQGYRGKNYSNPGIYTTETNRILIFDNGIIRKYDWTSYKNKYIRWCLDKGYFPAKRTYYWSERVKLYKRNLKQLKKNTFLKNSSIDLWDVLPVSVSDYIQIEKGNHAVEMLARIGMFGLAKDLIKEHYDKNLLKQNETELCKILKIDKARLKRLKNMNGRLASLPWMQYEKMVNTIWPDEMIKDFGDAYFTTSRFNFLPTPLSFVRIYNYIKKQSEIICETLHQTVVTWQDYICMAEQMKMNTKLEQIAMPKDLREAHDRLVLISKTKGLEKQAKTLEKKWPKVNKQLPKLHKFEYESGDYCIVAPERVIDIVKEGVILGHCVHTCDYYFSRIQTDESYLFFLRKKSNPDMPWYTLEVEPSGNIRQKRTTGDKQNKDFEMAVPFLKKWQQYFKKQLTKKEKELGAKSNILRQEEYKNLRENGNKVWHGPLAGKLLADVLEQDFMEAL